MFSILDNAYDDQLQLHSKLPEGIVGPGIRIALERYLNLQGTDLEFRDADKMEAFHKIKEEEIECLQRHLFKISSIDAYYHSNLKKLFTKSPKESLEIGENIRILKLVRQIKEILPRSIETNNGILKHLAEHIEKTRQQNEKIHNLQRLADDFQRLVRERDALATWASTVVPSSDAYANLTSRYDEVVRKLGEFKDGFLDSLRTDREALEEELPTLLTVTLAICYVVMVLLYYITGWKVMADRLRSIFPFAEMRTILNVVAYTQYHLTGNGGGCKALESAKPIDVYSGKSDGAALAKEPVKYDEVQSADVKKETEGSE